MKNPPDFAVPLAALGVLRIADQLGIYVTVVPFTEDGDTIMLGGEVVPPS